MDEFEKLLAEVSCGVERFVRYRLPSQTVLLPKNSLNGGLLGIPR